MHRLYGMVTTPSVGIIENTAFVIRALSSDIDFDGLARFAPVVLHQVVEQKVHLAMHTLAVVTPSAYIALMTWLIAASLANLRLRSVARVGVSIALLAAVCFGSAARAEIGDDPSGLWLTEAGDAQVRVSRCGDEICGRVVWLKDEIDPATSRPFTDRNNPDPELAKRPMIGLALFIGMKSVGPGKWSGHIYNADDGNTYVGNVSVSGSSTLKVEGCVGALCGGENWTRAH